MTRRLCFDVYGRYRVHVEWREGSWQVMRAAADGKRTLLEVVVPREVTESGLAQFLDDLLHEEAQPGDTVLRVEDETPPEPDGG